MEWAFLTDVSDEVVATFIEGLLQPEEIPVTKKYKEAGGYLNIYMGGSIYGIDLFVPKEYLEKARDIITTIPEAISEEEIGKEIEEEDL